MMTFDYQLTINATQEEVFNALTNPFQIELWTGYPAIMDDKEGTIFSLWEGDISGCNLKISRNREIVQEWFFGQAETPSIVTILLKKDAGRTRVEVRHTNIPAEVYEEIAGGWQEHYLGAVKDFLEFC